MIKRKVIEGMLEIESPYPFIPSLMFHISKDVVAVPVTHGERQEGDTGYTVVKLIKVFSNLIVSNSSLMLRVVGFIGLFCSVVSFLLSIHFILQKLLHSTTVAGWTSVIVTILFFGGLILFSVGIIGEYLIRIIAGVEKKPTYFVRWMVRSSDE